MTTHLPALTLASCEGRSFRLLTIAAFLAVIFAPTAYAQAPAAAASVAAAPSPAELEQLVSRIALYPDDLVSIILPASTNPLQIVQAERFLEKRKADPKAPVDEKWDDAVKALVNYPEVIKAMSSDLDWTSALGEAVVADQGAVLEAIQVFRRKTQAVGNLKSDSKQTVVVEKEVIKIVPADPQVIYVPQYNPTTVVVSGGYSSWGYYPAPYPVYYYPYPPGAAFATGLIWGAAIGAAWNGNRYYSSWGGGGNNNINVSRNTTINTGNINTGNINTGNRPGAGTGQRPGAGAGTPSQLPARGGAGSSQWKPNKQPGQVSGSIGKPSGGRVGDYGGSGARPSTQPSGGGRDFGGGSRPSTQPAGGGRDFGGGSRPSTQPAGGGRDHGGGAFGGGSASGRQTQMDSSRGAASRSSMSGAGGGRSGASAGSFGGGGARAGGGGGGGARAGGGGGGGARGGGGGGGRGGGGRR